MRRRQGHEHCEWSARQAARKVVRREQDPDAQGKGKRNRGREGKEMRRDAKNRRLTTESWYGLGSVWGEEGEIRRVSSKN
jgi:hypothetical protein